MFEPRDRDDLVRHAQRLHIDVLEIDVWDGASLLLIGTAALPLRHLLRGDQRCITDTLQLPLVAPAIELEDAVYTTNAIVSGSATAQNAQDSTAAEAPPRMGLLIVQVANIGRAAAPDWPTPPTSGSKCVVLPASTASTQPSRAHAVVERDAGLAAQLRERQIVAQDADTARKLARFAKLCGAPASPVGQCAASTRLTRWFGRPCRCWA